MREDMASFLQTFVKLDVATGWGRAATSDGGEGVAAILQLYAPIAAGFQAPLRLVMQVHALGFVG
jgi:hypothetical protein